MKEVSRRLKLYCFVSPFDLSLAADFHIAAAQRGPKATQKTKLHQYS